MRFTTAALVGILATVMPAPGVAQDATRSPSPTASPSPTPAETPPLSRRQLVDGLSDEDVARALEVLRKSFLDPTVVDEASLRRAGLEGLLLRLAPGTALLDARSETGNPAEYPFLAEILDSHIGYVRPGSITPASLAQFDATLADFPTKGVNALILDLRGISSAPDFDTAAGFARRLCPKGKLLFTLQKPSAKQERMFTSDQVPSFSGLIVVISDNRTSAGAEALAATLRANVGALLVGSDSSGAAVEFEDVPLGNGAVLRIATSQVLLPGTGALFPAGVKPDIAVATDEDVLDQIFQQSSEKGVSQFVFETERKRLNEAALVANSNPELDGAQTAQRERTRAATLRDTALQRAVDLVTAIQFYSKKRPD